MLWRRSGTYDNTGSLTGGKGGAGGDGGTTGAASQQHGGAGGDGGVGIAVTDGGTINNTGSLAGGTGGSGGTSGNLVAGGNGGDGGVGVMVTAGGIISNIGAVTGGRGGDGGSGASDGITGGGGAGITGSSFTIINSSTISGGLSGDGMTRANAIEFTGGNNTLTLRSGSSLTGNVAIDGGGSVTFNQSSDQTLANVITGNGSVIQDGPGTLTLNGENTYAGGTTIGSGTLAVGKDANLGGITSGLMLNGGTLRWNAAFDLGAGRSIALGAGGGTLDTGVYSSTIAQGITGAGGLDKTGSGTLILNGINTYAGTTTINAGTLEVGDDATPGARIAGAVDVNTDGTLRGHGTVGGNVINDGTVWPGGSIGTLTIGGNYTQGPAGTLMIDVSPAEASQLRVGGTANLGGSLALLYGPGTYTAKSYPIVTAAHVNGSFAAVSGSAVPTGLTQTVSYAPSGTAVDLNLLAAASGGAPGVPLIIAPTNATIFGDLGAALLRAGQHANEMLLDRLDGVCLPASEGGCARPGQRLWIQTEGTFTRVDGNRGAPDVHDRRYGFMVGADHAFGAWTAGIAGGYSHGDLWESGDEASGKDDTARLALYGGRALGRVQLSGTASYAYHFISTQRDFPGFGQTKGDGHAQEFAAALQASLPFALGRAVTLAPHLGLRYAYVDGLSEDESGLVGQRLNAQDQRLQSLQPYVGVTLNYAFTPSGTERQGHLQLRAGYAYETQDVDRDVTVVSTDGTRFVVPGTRDSRNRVTAGLGLDMPLGKATRIYARYDAVLPTGNVTAQSAQVGVSYRF